jgi:hypothetical protein
MKTLRNYSWTTAVDDAWVCPVCLSRTTARNRKLDLE